MRPQTEGELFIISIRLSVEKKHCQVGNRGKGDHALPPNVVTTGTPSTITLTR